jgi:hypothetical protein
MCKTVLGTIPENAAVLQFKDESDRKLQSRVTNEKRIQKAKKFHARSYSQVVDVEKSVRLKSLFLFK